jgi:hypothetical protein
MAQINLLTPLLDDGIRNTNFFNGRLLTADDLRTEQAAHRDQRRRLGRAIGPGVVDGLMVELIADGSSNTTPLVRVGKGLAINRLGQTLELVNGADVALRREPETTTAGDTGLFAACAPPTTDTLSTAAGIYLLALSPASDYREEAPMSGLSSNGNGALDGCGYRYAVEGVQFRLIFANVAQMPFSSTAQRQAFITRMNSAQSADHSRLRNKLAHFCFGTENLLDLPRDPWRYQQRDFPGGLLGWLRQTNALTDCDVPLALIFWQPGGVRFVDIWSVRRHPRPPATDARWPLALGGADPAHAEVIALQFQEQIAWLMRSQATRSGVRALDLFRYWPAAGILPMAPQGESDFRLPNLMDLLRVGGEFIGREELFRTPTVIYSSELAGLGLTSATKKARNPQIGFDYPRFFEGLSIRQPAQMMGARLSALLRDALTYPPIDLEGDTAIHLYVVRENLVAASGNAADRPGVYLVFASEHMAGLLQRTAVVDKIRTVITSVLDQQEGSSLPTAPTTAISGIGPKRGLLLAEEGITTLLELSTASPNVVAQRLKFNPERAEELINQARIQIGRT